MASHQLIAPLPLITLEAGYTLTVEAINQTTGAAVSGVVVSQVAIYAANTSDDSFAPSGALEFGATFAFAGEDE